MVFVLLIIFKMLQTKKFADIIIPRGAENFGMYIIQQIVIKKTVLFNTLNYFIQ